MARIVFMGLGYAENSHDRIADKLVDDSAMFGHHLGDLSEDTAHHFF
jgi:hypothetical protein